MLNFRPAGAACLDAERDLENLSLGSTVHKMETCQAPRTEKTGDVVCVVEHLCDMHKALVSFRGIM